MTGTFQGQLPAVTKIPIYSLTVSTNMPESLSIGNFSHLISLPCVLLLNQPTSRGHRSKYEPICDYYFLGVTTILQVDFAPETDKGNCCKQAYIREILPTTSDKSTNSTWSRNLAIAHTLHPLRSKCLLSISLCEHSLPWAEIPCICYAFSKLANPHGLSAQIVLAVLYGSILMYLSTHFICCRCENDMAKTNVAASIQIALSEAQVKYPRLHSL